MADWRVVQGSDGKDYVIDMDQMKIDPSLPMTTRPIEEGPISDFKRIVASWKCNNYPPLMEDKRINIQTLPEEPVIPEPKLKPKANPSQVAFLVSLKKSFVTKDNHKFRQWTNTANNPREVYDLCDPEVTTNEYGEMELYWPPWKVNTGNFTLANVLCVERYMYLSQENLAVFSSLEQTIIRFRGTVYNNSTSPPRQITATGLDLDTIWVTSNCGYYRIEQYLPEERATNMPLGLMLDYCEDRGFKVEWEEVKPPSALMMETAYMNEVTYPYMRKGDNRTMTELTNRFLRELVRYGDIFVWPSPIGYNHKKVTRLKVTVPTSWSA